MQRRSSARKAEPLGRSHTHSDRLSPPSGVCVTADHREREAQNPAHQELHAQSSEIQANHLRITPDKLKQRTDKLLGVGDSSSRDLVGGAPSKKGCFVLHLWTHPWSLPPAPSFQGLPGRGSRRAAVPAASLFDSGT